MQTFIIAVTFLLGVAVLVVGLVAFFKGRQGAKGSAKIFGMEISGTGAGLVLLVGLVLVLSGFGWASSQKQTTQAQQDKTVCLAEKSQVASGAAELHTQLQHEIQLRQQLVEQIPPTVRQQIQVQRPELVRPAAVRISPRLMEEIRR